MDLVLNAWAASEARAKKGERGGGTREDGWCSLTNLLILKLETLLRKSPMGW